jgi:MFS family permease
MARRPYHGWWIMLACIICQMDLGFAKDAMDVYMTYIVADFGWGRADFQVAGWVLLASYSLTSPTIGYLLDRLGARSVLALGAVALGLTFTAYSGMTSFGHYLLATPLLGIGIAALGDIPVSTVAARWFERHRGTVIGIVLIGSNIGAAIVNLLAKGLYRAFDHQWRPAVLVLGVLMVTLVLPVALLVIRDRRDDELPEEERRHGTAGEEPAAAERSLRLSEAAGTRTLWLLAFALFAYYFYYLFANRHIIAFLRDHDSFGHTVPAVLVTWLHVAPDDFPEFTKSMFEVIGLPGKLVCGYLIDRYRTRNALAWNFVLLAAGSALLPLIGTIGGAMWLFIAVHGLGWAVQQVLTPMAIADAFGLRHMGQIYGALMVVLFPAQIGTWSAGRVFDVTGSYEAFFPYCIALNAIAAAGLFFMRPHATVRA